LRGDTARALEFFRGLVQQLPGDPEVHFYYGATLGMTRDVPGALREYDEAIRLDPQYSRPYYFAYSLLVRGGQIERGVGYLQRLVQVNPQERDAQAVLQMLGREGGRAPGALPAPPAQP
jgi:tetratricopeptide (TPR) repeat protein